VSGPFTTGHTRYFVPIGIRGPNGFYGGPAGYHEAADKAEAEARGAIELKPGKPEFLMTDRDETVKHLRAAIRALRGDKELGDVCRGMIADDIEQMLALAEQRKSDG